VKVPRLQIIDVSDRRQGQARRRWTGAAALALAASLTAYAAAGADDGADPGIAAAPAAEGRTLGAGIDSYADVVEQASPTVVTIRSSRRARPAQQFPFANDPFFRRFFGDGENGPAAPRPPARERGLGSGVIVREDGYVLTNHHVVDGAEDIRVELSDRRTLKARIVGSDPPSDLAVLKVDASGLPAMRLGDSDAVRVGDVVLALGNPMGVGQTVTMGIVSATGRATGLGDGSFEDFLQTDAPINQGNSGGPLVNTRGELVGINSQILSPSGGNIGIGFAIPANMARSVMESLIEHGRVDRGMLGVTVQGITPELAESLGLETVAGALVSDVSEDGPASKAGVRRGDVITAIDGVAIADSNALRNHVAQIKPGTRASLSLIRDGRPQQLSVTLGTLPSRASAETPGGDDAGAESAAGLSVQPVPEATAERLGLDDGIGVLVAAVDPEGRAAEAGFERGDVIEQVDGVAVSDAGDVRDALKKAGDRPALVLVHRDGRTLYLPLSVA
jgi:Do/DeqQ family serine protease